MGGQKPRIGVVGAGAVAQTLGRLLAEGGETVVALASRTPAHARRAARFIEAAGASGRAPVEVLPLVDLPRAVSHLLIAVSDSAIGSVAERLAAAGMTTGCALHTSGASGADALNALRARGVSCGMLHPLQTIVTPEQGIQSLADAAFGLSGDAAALDWADSVIRIVTGNQGRALHIDASRLAHYHAGAVMASNAVLAALDAALELLADAGIDRGDALRAIAPLSRASLANALANGPDAALTGPVVRGDAATVRAHVAALADGTAPAVAQLYGAAARQLLRMARRRGLPEAGARAVEAALEGIGHKDPKTNRAATNVEL